MILFETIKKRLADAGVKPNKTLGQNFLVNPGIYQKILAALQITPGDIIVEVGSGLGTLTHHLARAGGKIIGIEKDRLLAEYLKKEFPVNSRVEIVNQDILEFNPKSYKLAADKYKLVGNIPYYLTSRLLRTALNDWPRPKLMVLMVQKEVAQRITARPPKMSLLAVSVQYYSRPEIVSYVSRGSFYPIPKVDSAIIRLQPRAKGLEIRNFFRVVKVGFANKRKQLASNLARDLKIPKQIVIEELLSLNISPQRRAETLTIEEWQKIAEKLVN
ncbi:MAG: 16S rRNA (adenine(1518)-N(6)/adenine(1519)-N(6))-dimethyltransferase RsmA [Patescibacteria group bacterium]